MIKINLKIENISTALEDIHEPETKHEANVLSNKLDAIVSSLSCPVCGDGAKAEVTLIFKKLVRTRIHPEHCCHREFSTILYRSLPPLLNELKQL